MQPQEVSTPARILRVPALIAAVVMAVMMATLTLVPTPATAQTADPAALRSQLDAAEANVASLSATLEQKEGQRAELEAQVAETEAKVLRIENIYYLQPAGERDDNTRAALQIERHLLRSQRADLLDVRRELSRLRDELRTATATRDDLAGQIVAAPPAGGDPSGGGTEPPAAPRADTTGAVTSMYQAALADDPSPERLHERTATLNQAAYGNARRAALAQVGAELFASPAYAERARSDEEFVQDLAQVLLGRAPTDAEAETWLGDLRGDTSRADLVTTVTGGDAFGSTPVPTVAWVPPAA